VLKGQSDQDRGGITRRRNPRYLSYNDPCRSPCLRDLRSMIKVTTKERGRPVALPRAFRRICVHCFTILIGESDSDSARPCRDLSSTRALFSHVLSPRFSRARVSTLDLDISFADRRPTYIRVYLPIISRRGFFLPMKCIRRYVRTGRFSHLSLFSVPRTPTPILPLSPSLRLSPFLRHAPSVSEREDNGRVGRAQCVEA